MTPPAAYVRRETLLSVAINSLLSLLFFAALFAPFAPVTPGWAGLGRDFVPQSFAITLMSLLVPGILTRRRLAAGLIAPLAERVARPRALVWRALLAAGLAAGFGAAVGLALAAAAGKAVVPWAAGAAIKVAYGAALAAVVTPPGVRAILRSGADHLERRQA